jgi:hypothetical protein
MLHVTDKSFLVLFFKKEHFLLGWVACRLASGTKRRLETVQLLP